MDSEQFTDNCCLIGRELLGNRSEESLQFLVIVLGGEGLGPVEGDVEMAAAVVGGAEFAAGGAVVFEEFAGGGVEGVGQYLGLGKAEGLGDVFEAGGEGEEFAKGVPAEVVFLGELLDVFRGGAAGAGFEESAAVHERDDGEHLRGGADFKNGKEVGKVIAQDVAGNGDRVQPLDETFQGEGAGLGGSEDAEVEAGGVVILQVGFDFCNEPGVVGAVFIEPEDGGGGGGAGAVHGELHPILNRGVLGLTGAPDVSFLHFVGKESHWSLVIGHWHRNDAKRPVRRNLEGFVVGAVFLGGLGHEADVGDAAHGFWIEGTVFFAEINHGLIDAGVATVGDDGQGVPGLAGGVPHVAAFADHGGHGGVDNDVAGDVEVRNALVGIHHGDRGLFETLFNVGFDGGFLVGGEGRDLGDEVAEAVRRVIKKSGTKTRHVAMALPGSAVITKKIILPGGMTEAELESQVESEANQYIPFSLDEVSLDFCMVGPSATSAGDVEVLIAASRKEKVQDRQGLAEAAGLKPMVVDVESYASRLATARLIENLPNKGLDALVALFEVGALTTSMQVIKNDEVLYERDQAFGGAQLTQLIVRQYGFSPEEAENKKRSGDLPEEYESGVLKPFVEGMAQEIGRALQFFFTSTPHNKVDYIMLAGGSSALPGLTQSVTEQTTFACMQADPFKGMTVGSHVREKKMRSEVASYLTACGLALRRFVR